VEDDLLWRNLKELPAFRALLRAVEAQFYQDLLPLEEPVLDLGCGDGHFASITFPSPLTVGIDPAVESLREAQGRGSYRWVSRSLGGALPFPAAAFPTVISNSVLEHIPELDPVLSEIARVLRRGGRFIFCVPGNHFGELLFFSQLAQRVGWPAMAQSYERYFNRISRHHHCDSVERWEHRLARVDLQIEDSFTYFSRQAHRALDLGHYLGLPSLLSKKLFGKWILVPTRWNLALTERLLRPLFEEAPPARGAYSFFLARKMPCTRKAAT
jgi:SAM-dependent methyltransferase